MSPFAIVRILVSLPLGCFLPSVVFTKTHGWVMQFSVLFDKGSIVVSKAINKSWILGCLLLLLHPLTP